MTPERAEALATLAEALRAPLSRVRLCAQRAGRAGASPLCHELLGDLDAAVVDLDRRIERLCEALRPRPSQCVDDCGAVLRDTLERLAPVLAARGTPCTPVGSAPRLPGDGTRVRRAALELLRGVGRLGGRGALSLRLVPAGPCAAPEGEGAAACHASDGGGAAAGIELWLEPEDEIAPARIDRVREELRAFGALEDLRFEGLEEPPACAARPLRLGLHWDPGAEPGSVERAP